MLYKIINKSNYIGLKVWNEDMWGNVTFIPSIRGQGNRLIGYYMSPTLYARIFLTPYQKATNPDKSLSYPTGATQAACNIIKDTWERDLFEFVTG